MASTTDFEEWFGLGNEPDGHEDAYALYESLNGSDYGSYEARHEKGKIFITGPSGDTLALVSPKAIKAFSQRLQDFKDDPEMDWESWYGYKRAMAKDD